MAAFVDWDLAIATAGALSRSGPTVSYAEAAEVVADLRRVTDEAAGHVQTFTGLTPGPGQATVRVVDRKDWAAVNIAGLRQVITPLVSKLSGDREPGSIAGAVGSRVTGRPGRYRAGVPVRKGARAVRGVRRATRARCCWSRRTSSRWNAGST